MSWDSARAAHRCDRCDRAIHISLKHPYVSVAKYDFEDLPNGALFHFCEACKPLVLASITALCTARNTNPQHTEN